MTSLDVSCGAVSEPERSDRARKHHDTVKAGKFDSSHKKRAPGRSETHSREHVQRTRVRGSRHTFQTFQQLPTYVSPMKMKR